MLEFSNYMHTLISPSLAVNFKHQLASPFFSSYRSSTCKFLRRAGPIGMKVLGSARASNSDFCRNAPPESTPTLKSCACGLSSLNRSSILLQLKIFFEQTNPNFRLLILARNSPRIHYRRKRRFRWTPSYV